MQQQINFYQEQFREKPITLPTRRLAVIIAVVLTFFAMLSAWQIFSLSRVNSTLAQWQERHHEAQQQVETYTQLYPKPQLDASLDGRIEQTRSQLGQQQQLLGLLQGEGSRYNLSGFSAHLVALARQTVDGAWLTNILLYDGGQNIALMGTANSASQVPVLLNALSREEPYQGQRFGNFAMARQQQDHSGVAHFSVGTARPTQLTIETEGRSPLERYMQQRTVQ
ncbi:PilN domain-containing protein [Desulfurispira natronophila]|uniref:MSHA biogenesis protein MshI n=1 Tax=Desulfurispira natronophila TaxID=682562 RepID=A0A7W7Y3A4_9BACT|nr:PilN domain-containing protein [Desulfurispira natronophila]MBB5021268.1 hypothetical protein [Desulfurispira natronophila]